MTESVFLGDLGLTSKCFVLTKMLDLKQKSVESKQQKYKISEVSKADSFSVN